MPTLPMIRASATAFAVTSANLAGPEAARLLLEVGIDPALVGDLEGDVPLRAHVALLERLAEVLADPLFGLRAGLRLSPPDFGVLGYVLMSSRDVGSAMTNLARYIRVHQDGADILVELDDEHARIAYRLTDPTMTPRRQDAEHSIGAALACLRYLFGPGFRPAQIWLEHAAPPDVGPVRELLDADPSYGRPVNAVGIDRELLRHPLPQHDPRLLAILERHAAELASKRGDAPRDRRCAPTSPSDCGTVPPRSSRWPRRWP